MFFLHWCPSCSPEMTYVKQSLFTFVCSGEEEAHLTTIFLQRRFKISSFDDIITESSRNSIALWESACQSSVHEAPGPLELFLSSHMMELPQISIAIWVGAVSVHKAPGLWLDMVAFSSQRFVTRQSGLQQACESYRLPQRVCKSRLFC